MHAPVTIPTTRLRVLSAVLLTTVLAFCTGSTEAHSPLEPFYGQQIDWAACPDDTSTMEADESATFQCGVLRVPLDYAVPGGDTIELALARQPAGVPDRRLGSLVLNPGGPGGSGVGFVQQAADLFSGGVHNRYDLVGFDPRGVGASSPVDCLDDLTLAAWTVTDEPAADLGRKFTDACQARSGKVLAHVSTREAARDLDILRSALGEPKLNYLGFSYGTYLGTVYAEQFPGRTGRLVLDGAVDPALSLLDVKVQQDVAFEGALRDFAAACVGQDGCSLGADPEQAAQRLADFLDGLREKPLSARGGRKLTSSAAWTGVLSGFYQDSSGWPDLRAALHTAMVQGDGDPLLNRAESAYGKNEDGSYDNGIEANTAVSCSDPGADAPSAAQLQAAMKQLHDRAPLLSKRYQEEDLLTPDCRAWPYRSPEQPRRVTAAGSAPILVIGSTGDPATPYAWAQSLAAGLSDATLLTRDGDGHTGYGMDDCTTRAVDKFLLDGTMPAAGTVCPEPEA